MAIDTQILDLLSEYARIRHGEHTGWKGDPVLNSEFYIRRFYRDNPHFAQYASDSIEVDSAHYIEETGLPPGALTRIIKMLRGQ